MTTTNDEIYGRSPALEAIAAIIAFRAVPEEDRVYAIARHVEERLGFDE